MHLHIRSRIGAVNRHDESRVPTIVRPCHRAAHLKVVCSSQPSQHTSEHLAQTQQPSFEQEELKLLEFYAGKQLPSQADELCTPSDRSEEKFVALVEPSTRSIADLDYLSVRVAHSIKGRCPGPRMPMQMNFAPAGVASNTAK